MILRALVPSSSGGCGLTDRRDGDRGVSPVVAVVLLLGLAVALAAVAGPFVFGVIGDFGSDSPDADFSFHYEQGQPLDFDASTDDFGTQVGDGTGVVTIQFQNGETLDPANVEIRGRVSGGNLLDNTSDAVFAEGDVVREGERITLTAMRTETVQIIWTGDGESAVIGEFTIDAPTSLTGPWVPDADVGCEYIEDQLDSGTNHIKVIGVVVECDFTAYYPQINDISIKSQNGDFGAVIGEVNGTGDINIQNGGTFQGNLESGTDGSSGDIDIKNGSTVYSDVVAKGDGYVDIDGQSKVEGTVDAVQGVSLQSDSSVSGDIVSGTDGNGDVDITDSRVGGSITTNGNGSGNVDIDKNSTVGGPVDAMGTVDVQKGSVVDGPITSGTDGSDGKVKLTSSDVNGNITVEGSNGVDVLSGSDVDGHIETPGHVTVKGDSSAAGGIVSGADGSGGDIQVSSSEVAGPITAQSSGKIDISSQSTVDGAITANDGVVQVSGQSAVDSPVTAHGGVIIQGTSTVDAGLTVESTTDITVADTSQVNGSITANGSGNLNVKDSSTVEGGITANVSGNFNIQSSSTVGGPLETDRCAGVSGGSSVAGDILMGASATASNQCTTTVSSSNVGGAVVAQGAANLDVSDSIIQGPFNPEPDSTLTCSNSTINGQNCSTAKQPALALNITSIDSSVSQGDTLTIDLTVENKGFGGEKDLPMLVNGTEELVKQDINLSRNEVDSGIQFQWNTSSTSPGSYNLTIASDIQSESRTVYIAGSSSPAWSVESVSSNDEVFAGDTLNVSATIKNNGQANGTTTVRLLDFDGQTVDTRNVTIAKGGSQAITLQWDTNSSDVGTGSVTVETDIESGTESVEVLQNVYDIENVNLYGQGQDLEVELFLNLSNSGTVDIEVFDGGGNRLDNRTVTAKSDVFTVLDNKKAKDVTGEVVVTLYDKNGNQRDSATRNWDGGS